MLTINWPDSLGLFYAVFTGFLGFIPNSDEWKVMGLAPYGKPGVDFSMFLDLASVSLQGPHCESADGNGGDPYSGWPEALGSPREPESEISDLHKDIAYAVQDMCEDRNDERGASGARENAQQESLPRWRRRPQFQSQRQNCRFRHCR